MIACGRFNIQAMTYNVNEPQFLECKTVGVFVQLENH